MELLDAMQTMNACRYFKPDAVSDELLAKVLNAARWAATGSMGSDAQPLFVGLLCCAGGWCSTTIGRAGCTVTIDDPFVDDVHAEVRRGQGGWRIRNGRDSCCSGSGLSISGMPAAMWRN